MSDYDFLPASDGSGDAPKMNITADRVIGSMTIAVDDVTNVPAKFIATSGKLLASGFIDPTTKKDFKGHLDGANLAIDAFEPGSTDNGNVEGEVVIIKPNTGWTNRVAAFIMNATGLGTPENLTVDGLTAATVHATGQITGDAGLQVTGGTIDLPANSLVKGDMEKPHYNCLVNSSDTGQVFSNSQVDANFNAEDTTNGYGIVADTTAHTLKTARAGLYDIDLRFRCIDVAASDFICWIYISDDNGATWTAIRQQDQAIGVNQGDVFSINGLYLDANVLIKAQVYNGGGATRFGFSATAGTSAFWKRAMAYSLTVKEVR